MYLAPIDTKLPNQDSPALSSPFQPNLSASEQVPSLVPSPPELTQSDIDRTELIQLDSGEFRGVEQIFTCTFDAPEEAIVGIWSPPPGNLSHVVQ